MPPEYLKRPISKKVIHCVFFFGSYDYGWLPEADLRPYQEFKTKWEMSTTKTSLKKYGTKKAMATAIDEIEAYIEGGCKMKDATIFAMSKGAVVMPVIIGNYLLIYSLKFIMRSNVLITDNLFWATRNFFLAFYFIFFQNQ